MVTLEDVRNNKEVRALIEGAQRQLDGLGYTEHSYRHIGIVSKRSGDMTMTANIIMLKSIFHFCVRNSKCFIPMFRLKHGVA